MVNNQHISPASRRYSCLGKSRTSEIAARAGVPIEMKTQTANEKNALVAARFLDFRHISPACEFAGDAIIEFINSVWQCYDLDPEANTDYEDDVKRVESAFSEAIGALVYVKDTALKHSATVSGHYTEMESESGK